MEARPFQDAYDADKVERKVQIIFHAFGGPKYPQWGGLIQVALERHTGQRGLKNKSAQNDFNPKPDHRSCCLDRGGVNGSSNRARMRKIELFKV